MAAKIAQSDLVLNLSRWVVSDLSAFTLPIYKIGNILSKNQISR